MYKFKTSFLNDVASKLYTEYGDQMHELTLVFSNEQAIYIFQKHLANQIKNPIASPRLLTLRNLIEELSQLNLVSSLKLVAELYQALQTIKPSQESLEQFYGWGNILLQDFDRIDKSLVNPHQLFSHLSAQKALTENHSYLNESQKKAIRSFWQTFDERLSKHQKAFLQFWELLPLVYDQFTKQLINQNIGYDGLAYRQVYQGLKSNQIKLPYPKLAIIGFHALHAVEEQIFALLQEKANTHFFWDIDAYYMEDEKQEAGYYLRNYLDKPYFKDSFEKPFPNHIQGKDQTIELFAVNSDLGQVQLVAHKIQALIQKQGNDFKATDIAIVLANERLFLPMCRSLPQSIQTIITTLGYPLQHTLIYQLIEHLLKLQLAIRQADCPSGYLPTTMLMPILNHPHIQQACAISQTTHHQLFKDNPPLYSKQSELAAIHPLYQSLFQILQPQDDLITYLKSSLSTLDQYLSQSSAPLLITEQKAFAQVYQQLTTMQQNGIQPKAARLLDCLQLIAQVIAPMQMHFHEQNREGIQILRMEETNNLDCKYVFMVGMNEGCFPNNSQPNSFIPYNLRKGYGLPTTDTWQTSVDAYYFYRLLQRAQKVYISYSNQSATGKNQELSRYLWQLIYESHLPIKQHHITLPVQLHSVAPIIIQKDELIQKALEQFLVKSDQDSYRLTPSALNSYLTCSLQFYFRYIAQIKPKLQTLAANDIMRLGHLFHQAMEHLYQPLLSQPKKSIDKQAVASLRPKVNDAVKAILMQNLHQGDTALVEGQDSYMILQTIISKLIHKILDIDQAYTPFTLVGLEMGRKEPLQQDFVIAPDKVVGLRGIIDRVDAKEGKLRTVDYKTGYEDQQINSIASLFDRHNLTRNSSAFQLVFYAWLYKKVKAKPEEQVMPAMYNTRTLFGSHFDPHLWIKASDNQSYPITDITAYEAAFESGLKTVLNELFDPAIPFQQTEDIQHCSYCPYQRICQRT